MDYMYVILGMEPPTPELLDKDIDSRHRSYRFTVLREELPVLRPRPPGEALSVDGRWMGR